jgi:hypothetical protein
VKYLCGLELSFDSLLTIAVSHVSWLTSIVVCRYISMVTNPVQRADSSSIAMRS